MQYTLHEADKRGTAHHGWLQSRFSFSFSNYYNPEMMGFGTLRVINDDIVSGGNGFGAHPHQNMEIISIPTYGLLEHKDSLGTVGVVTPGEVQVISAGSGVTHSEYNGSTDEEVRFFQIWITPHTPNVSPRYEQKFFEEEGRKNNIQLLVSPDGRNDSIFMHQDAFISRVFLEKGKSIKQTIEAHGHGRYIFVISGAITVNENPVQQRDGLAIIGDEDLSVLATENSDFLLFEVPMNS